MGAGPSGLRRLHAAARPTALRAGVGEGQRWLQRDQPRGATIEITVSGYREHDGNQLILGLARRARHRRLHWSRNVLASRSRPAAGRGAAASNGPPASGSPIASAAWSSRPSAESPRRRNEPIAAAVTSAISNAYSTTDAPRSDRFDFIEALHAFASELMWRVCRHFTSERTAIWPFAIGMMTHFSLVADIEAPRMCLVSSGGH